MGVFSYTAGQFDATVVRGTIVADSPRQARDLLRERGMSIHDLREAGPSRHSGSPRSGWQLPSLDFRGRGRGRGYFRGSENKVLSFVQELATLLGVGMPLLEAMDCLARQHRGWFQRTIMAMRERVAAGQSLADAMRYEPDVFDDVVISMTDVGENAGSLDQVLIQLADYRQRLAQLKGKVGSALIYPVIVVVAGVGVSIFLMTYVVPGLLDSLVEAGKPLPWITQVVKSISDLLVGWWWAILLTTITAAVALGWAMRTERGRRTWHRWLLKTPMLGDLVRKQAVVSIAFVTSTLMRSGISFEKAIQITQRSTRNRVLREGLRRCEDAVHAGRDLAAALTSTDVFPEAMVQVFALGQQTGRLEEMLDRLAADYDRQVATAAARLASAMEPVLILILALIVGAIAFATILPILEVGNVI